MNAPDFATIIKAALLRRHNDAPIGDTAALLAAKVPELCSTCNGRGYDTSEVVHISQDDQGTATYATCPDCPTIAKLLAIGAAVMTAEVNGVCIRLRGDSYSSMLRHADMLLAELRAVQP